MATVFIALALLMVSVRSENSTASDAESADSCEAFGPWSQALEDWATAPLSDRHGTFCSFIHTHIPTWNVKDVHNLLKFLNSYKISIYTTK